MIGRAVEHQGISSTQNFFCLTKKISSIPHKLIFLKFKNDFSVRSISSIIKEKEKQKKNFIIFLGVR